MSARSLFPVGSEMSTRPGWKRCLLLAVVTALVLLLFASVVRAQWKTGKDEPGSVRQKIEREVVSALKEANGHYSDLLIIHQQGFADELRRSELLVEKSRGALRRAQVLIGVSGGKIDAELARQVRTLDRDLTAVEKDMTLLRRLEDIRLESAAPKGKLGPGRSAAEYEKAFREAGIDPAAQKPEDVAALIRKSPLRDELVAALDDWALATADKEVRPRLLRIVRLADPDPWRDRLRDAFLKNDKQALTKLTQAAEMARLPQRTVATVAVMLERTGADAEPWLQRAHRLYPADFWISFALANIVSEKKPAEAVASYRAALAIQPANAVAYNRLGVVQTRLGMFDEAVQSFRKAIRLEPRLPGVYANLGVVMRRQGKLDEAIACFRKALEIDPPTSTAALKHLGIVLQETGRLQEAIALFRRAVELDPADAEARRLLETALKAAGKSP
jgi:cytochrome c-type biogenesis protein CcmH/NrfG